MRIQTRVRAVSNERRLEAIFILSMEQNFLTNCAREESRCQKLVAQITGKKGRIINLYCEQGKLALMENSIWT